MTWQTGFDAEAYVEKLIGQICSEILSDRILEGVVATTAGREHDRRILYRQIGKGRINLTEIPITVIRIEVLFSIRIELNCQACI